MPHRKRILLAEDDPQDAELVLSVLRDHNLSAEIVLVRDGEEALQYLFRSGPHAGRPEGNPAAALLDIKMPKVDGLEVLRQLKAHPELCLLPVVMLTSSREDRDVEACYRLGANAYVVKPVEFGRFVEVLRELATFWLHVNEPPPGFHRRPPPVMAPSGLSRDIPR